MYGGLVMENEEGDGFGLLLKLKKQGKKIWNLFNLLQPVGWEGGCFKQIKLIVGIIKE